MNTLYTDGTYKTKNMEMVLHLWFPIWSLNIYKLSPYLKENTTMTTISWLILFTKIVLFFKLIRNTKTHWGQNAQTRC